MLNLLLYALAPLLLRPIRRPRMSASVRRAAYEAHLQSAYWRRARALCLARAGYKCQLCSRATGLEAHQNTYAHFGRELEHLEDLTALCDRCHHRFHGRAA